MNDFVQESEGTYFIQDEKIHNIYKEIKYGKTNHI